jgi:hypothetical protein
MFSMDTVLIPLNIANHTKLLRQFLAYRLFFDRTLLITLHMYLEPMYHACP